MNNNPINDSEVFADKFDNEAVGEDNPKFRRPKKIFEKRKTLIILLSALGVIVLAGLVVLGIWLFAPEEEYDDSAAFYFASDILTEEGAVVTVYENIDFKIYNYADSLRVSKEPIDSFTVKVKADGKDITGKSTIDMDETAMEPEVRSECRVSVSVPEKYLDSTIEVTVTSEPIKKTLTGSFTIEPAWDYELIDAKGNVCAELVISANRDVTLELDWDEEELIAKSTDSYVRTAENGESKCKIPLSAGMSTTIHLFKNDIDKEYTKKTKAVKLTELEEEVPESETPDTAEVIETEEVE